MVIFGIDPGYAIVGWGAIGFKSNTYKALGFGAVETQAGILITDLSIFMMKSLMCLIVAAPMRLQ
mgnify:CR=1 FL=1